MMSQEIGRITKIDNGYLLTIGDHNTHYSSVNYAADATGIAELIIAAAAREVLGVGEQQELFSSGTNLGVANPKTKGQTIP